MKQYSVILLHRCEGETLHHFLYRIFIVGKKLMRSHGRRNVVVKHDDTRAVFKIRR